MINDIVAKATSDTIWLENSRRNDDWIGNQCSIYGYNE
jgi:hypothetical protein